MVAVKVKGPVKRFVPPTPPVVYQYMLKLDKGVNSLDEAGKFCDFYESNGWKVGKNKMKSWQASVRNWLKGYKEKHGNKDILQNSSDSDWHLKEQGF